MTADAWRLAVDDVATAVGLTRDTITGKTFEYEITGSTARVRLADVDGAPGEWIAVPLRAPAPDPALAADLTISLPDPLTIEHER